MHFSSIKAFMLRVVLVWVEKEYGHLFDDDYYCYKTRIVQQLSAALTSIKLERIIPQLTSISETVKCIKKKEKRLRQQISDTDTTNSEMELKLLLPFLALH